MRNYKVTEGHFNIYNIIFLLLLQNKERLLYETNNIKQRFVFSLFYNEFDVGRYV